MAAYYFKVIRGPPVTGTPVGSRTVVGPLHRQKLLLAKAQPICDCCNSVEHWTLS